MHNALAAQAYVGSGFSRILGHANEMEKEQSMLTRREAMVAALACGATCLVTIAPWAAAPALSSSIYDWTAMQVESTNVGARRTVFRSPTATLDELECHITTLNPGHASHAPHRHPEEEIIVVKEGTVESLVNGTLQRVGPGSVIFQASNQEHAIRNVGDTPATYHVFSWKSPVMRGSTR
jgi:XRE family transcriptional regulator, regulator of sulfur utilization